MKFAGIILVVVGVLAFQFRDTILDQLSDRPAVLAAKHEKPVVLYATSWCGYCQKTRDFLRENNISFVEYDIEESAVGRQQYDELRGQGVPLLLVNGKVVRGYDPQRINALL